MSEWVDEICRIPVTFRAGGKTLRKLFQPASPHVTDRPEFIRVVTERLRADTQLSGTWQTYSYDKRGSSSPYLDGLEVGFFDGARLNIRIHQDEISACADFIHREAAWVLLREQAR